MSTSEKGHAKHVDNFRDLINFIRAYGARYNPSKNSLKLAQMESALLEAQMHLDNVTNVKSIYEDTVNKRALAFAGLKAFSTRLINALDSTDASPNKIKNAKTYHRKLQGKRASPTSNTITETANLPESTTSLAIIDNTNITTLVNTPDANMPIETTISTSQQSYTQQLQHFSGLISVLKTETSYMPNEVELQIATLEAMKNDLSTKNDDVSNAYVAISNARLERDKKLYKNTDSLYEVAMEAKKYIKALFGANSPEFAQIRGLDFQNR